MYKRFIKKFKKCYFSGSVIAVLSFLILVICIFFVMYKSKEDVVIRFGSQGFYPRTVAVDVGTKVTFKGSAEFWPAGDPHPEHGGYAGFDPLTTLKEGEEWSFVFDKAGTWGFHDHIESYYTGTIIVGDVADIPENLDEAILHCKQKAGGGADCFNELVKRSIEADGLKRGFEIFEFLYDTEPDFVKQGCHWVAHAVGEAAYRRRLEGEDVEFTNSTAYCGYGFYHGYIQALFHVDPDIRKVQNLCVEVGKKLGKEIPRVRANCFHGIGHGLIDDPPPKSQWGNPKQILANAFKVCPNVSSEKEEVDECYQGAYNGLASLAPEMFGKSFKDASALDFCAREPEDVRIHCYYEIIQKISLPGHAISAISDFIYHIEPRFREMAVGGMAAGIVQQRILDEDQTYGITGCRSLAAEFQVPCIKGVVGGYFAHGYPGKEYAKALDFCGNKAFSKKEKTFCYDHIVIAADRIYSRDTINSLICPKFEAGFACGTISAAR